MTEHCGMSRFRWHCISLQCTYSTPAMLHNAETNQLEEIIKERKKWKQTWAMKRRAESKSFSSPWLPLSPCSLEGGTAKHLGKLQKPECIDFPRKKCAHARACVFVRRPLYCNKENSLADICLETEDKSGSVRRCFNLPLRRALTPAFSCRLLCN